MQEPNKNHCIKKPSFIGQVIKMYVQNDSISNIKLSYFRLAIHFYDVYLHFSITYYFKSAEFIIHVYYVIFLGPPVGDESLPAPVQAPKLLYEYQYE